VAEGAPAKFFMVVSGNVGVKSSEKYTVNEGNYFGDKSCLSEKGNMLGSAYADSLVQLLEMDVVNFRTWFSNQNFAKFWTNKSI